MATQEKKMATPASTLNVPISAHAHVKRIARQLQHIDTQVSRHAFRDEDLQKKEATSGEMSPVGPQRSPTFREKEHERRCRDARKQRDFADRVEIMAAAAVVRDVSDASTCSISPRSAQIVAEAVATKQAGDVSTSILSPRSARIQRLMEKGPRTAQSARDLVHHFDKKAEKVQARKIYKAHSSLSNLFMPPRNEDTSAASPDVVPEKIAPSTLPVASYTIYEKVPLLFTLLLASMALLLASMALSAQYSDTQCTELKGQFAATTVSVENFSKDIQVLNDVNVNNTDKVEMLQEQVISLAQGKETALEWLEQKEFELTQKNDMLAQQKSELLRMSNELLQKDDELVHKNSELVQKDSELAQKATELAESQLTAEKHRQAHLEANGLHRQVYLKTANACTQALQETAYASTQALQTSARECEHQMSINSQALKKAEQEAARKCYNQINIHKNAEHAQRRAGLEAAHECRKQINSLKASSKTAQMGTVLCNMQLDDAQMELNGTMWMAIQHMFGMQM